MPRREEKASNRKDVSIQVLVGTAFTDQGQLKKAGSLDSGTCNFQFDLWDAADSGGT